MSFDDAPRLAGGQLSLTPLRREDLPGVAAAMGDPAIWAGHPDTERWRPERAQAFLATILERGGGMVVRTQGSDTVIGLSRFYPAAFHPDAIAIGYTFLIRAHWGGRSNAALKSLMLDHALASFEAAEFHVGPGNARSQAALARIGARLVHDGEVTLEDGPARRLVYVISRADRALGAGGAL